jgi:hypothetical protein
VYDVTGFSYDLGESERCDCCSAGCFGAVDPACCREVVDFVCVEAADPAVHSCCITNNFKITGGQIKLFRTGDFACKNGGADRNCTDPWTPPTRTLQETGDGCNVYQTDRGFLLGPPVSFEYPCPDAPHEDYVTWKFGLDISGADCEACGGPLGNLYEQTVEWEVNVPVSAELRCCGDGTSKNGCNPCPETVAIPGSGVLHSITVTALSAVQYDVVEFTGSGPTGFQTVTKTALIPPLVFTRRLSCTSTPAGEWAVTAVGFAGPCDPPPPDCGTVGRCDEQDGTLCNCQYDYPDPTPPGCNGPPQDQDCPSCFQQELPTYAPITVAAAT